MSKSLESLIRPFQTNDITPAQTYFEAGEVATPENVVLQIGKGGSGKVLTGSYSYSQTFYCDGAETEKAIAEFRKNTAPSPGGSSTPGN
jgi:hypothetical protein